MVKAIHVLALSKYVSRPNYKEFRLSLYDCYPDRINVVTSYESQFLSRQDTPCPFRATLMECKIHTLHQVSVFQGKTVRAQLIISRRTRGQYKNH